MIFMSPQHALKWAYETISMPIVKGSSVHRMRGEEQPSSDEISSHDRHAQAALIVTLCERVLSSVHMAYVRVQFGREVRSIEPLERHIAACFGNGMYARRGIEQIIRAYCGEKQIGLREIRRSMSCGTLKAANLRNIGYDTLDAIHMQAMDRLDEGMRAAGLIQEGPVSRPWC